MNLRMTISVLLAALLAGCDSSSTTAGTSSETVTGLQILANSAEAIVSRVPSASSARAAQTMDVPDSLKPRLDSVLLAERCGPEGRTSHYGPVGNYDRFVRNASAGREGRGCSLDYGWFRGESEKNDSKGWSRYAGVYSESGVRYVADPTFGNMALAARIEFVGSGTWRLRSGVTLVYDSMYAQFAPLTRFVQRIRFAGTCRVDLDFDLSAPIDAPVWCDGAMVGRFTWDNVGAPVVRDLQGRKVMPQAVVLQNYSEDSIGLWSESSQWDTVSGVLRFGLRLGWRLLDGDVLDVGDSITVGVVGSSLSSRRISLGTNGQLEGSLPVLRGADSLVLSLAKLGFVGQFRIPLGASSRGAARVR